MNKYDRSLLYIIVRPIVNVLFKIVFHPHIEGLENIPDGACIEVGNHTSILDPLLLMSANKRELHFLAKKELFTGFKGILFSNLGLIPVDRSMKNPNAIKDAIGYLESGETILIFPEGTTEKGRGLMEFKMGAIKIASASNKEIVPFVIKGKYRILGKGIHLTFLKPMRFKEVNEEENKRLRNTIKSVLEEG